MQRAAFPELQGRARPRRHRRAAKPDRVLVVLKIATAIAAAGLVGVIILLTGGHDTASSAKRPAGSTGQSGDDATAEQTPSTQQLVIDPPALLTETASIAAPRTTTESKPPKPAPPKPTQNQGFAVVGQRCQNPGAFSVTSDYQPVVCMNDKPNGPDRWHPVF